MAKKSSSGALLGYVYVVGLALVVIGCFLPLTSHFGGRANGATAVSRISKGGLVSVGAVLALIGAAAGIAVSFLRIKHVWLCKLGALLVSVFGGLYVLLNISGSQKQLISAAAKLTGSTFGIGFYVIIIGWLIAAAGAVLGRK